MAADSNASSDGSRWTVWLTAISPSRMDISYSFSGRRVEGHEVAIRDLMQAGAIAGSPSSADIAAMIDTLDELHADRNWEEFDTKARMQRGAARQILREWHQDAKNREDEAEAARIAAEEQVEREREAAVLAQIAREERIAAEAAEVARLATEAKADNSAASFPRMSLSSAASIVGRFAAGMTVSCIVSLMEIPFSFPVCARRSQPQQLFWPRAAPDGSRQRTAFRAVCLDYDTRLTMPACERRVGQDGVSACALRYNGIYNPKCQHKKLTPPPHHH